MIKKLILIVITLLLFPRQAFASHAPDFHNSSLSAITANGEGQAPADGKTVLKVTVTMKDAYSTALSGETVSISCPDDPAPVITPATAILDSHGSATFEVTSTHISTISVAVTDKTQNVTFPGFGNITFYSPLCHDSAPGSAPKLISATAISLTKILLKWTPATNPVTYYLLAYGTTSGKYIYGSDNIGDHNATSYIVGSLTPNKKYYFKVRAGNNCAPGAFSNEISAITTLEAASLEPTPTTAPTVKPDPVLVTPEPVTPEPATAIIKPTFPLKIILPLVLAGVLLISTSLLVYKRSKS